MFLVVELKIEEKLRQKPAVFEIRLGKLKLVSGGNWLPETWLEEKLSKCPKIGVEQFIRTADGESIIRGLVEVLPIDSKYLEAWRQEFEREGFYAEIVDEKRAGLWENIRGSGLDGDIQDKVVYGIQRLSDEAIDNIQKELAKIL
ncbi:MAG: hypothetical protein AAB731_03230 [Patescibacteria group bacterium]